jgi:flavin-dependent dehydrogenase
MDSNSQMDSNLISVAEFSKWLNEMIELVGTEETYKFLSDAIQEQIDKEVIEKIFHDNSKTSK